MEAILSINKKKLLPDGEKVENVKENAREAGKCRKPD
ncbi:hypothetical protein CDSM653_01510 [Caldanaerobacter subterraneus subsp. pacificus DSM 12653]|uniref:Uncharacterized protein n=1 Tax=Caldanaerobacter subterraneus subsp. pacificus DSM 12653 TaxID=391606 RepID=A0A0F5PLE6_9THEO|nr:hypothetical protein CDSM653_01510 [Caldanaerobacter subterraneus subsp. pacificus DSM 12653]